MTLSPEEWRRALALSGASNDTMNLLNGFGEPAPQNRPPVVQLPAETQQALERTGSGYRLPSVEVGPIEMKTRQPDGISRGNVPDNPYGPGTGRGQPERMQLPEMPIEGDTRPVARGGVPENPYPQSIGERPFNPNASSKQLHQELAQGQNESLSSFDQKTGIAQQALGREAELAGGLAQQRQAELDAGRARVDTNREQQHAFEQAATARLDKISQLVDNPPDQSKGMVLRIIGAVIANSPKFNGGQGGSGGGAIGAGLSMIGQSMAGDIKGWHDEIAANRELHESLLAQSKNEQADSEHELRMTGALTDLGFGVYDAALKQARAGAQSEEEARVNDELRNGLRQKYVAAQLEINGMRAKQAGAGKEKAEFEEYMRMPPEALATAVANGRFGDGTPINATLANRALDTRRKSSQTTREGEADIVLKQEQANKLRGEAGGKSLTAGGLVFAPGATPVDKGKAQEAVVSQGDLDTALANMQRLQGSLSPQDKKQYDLNHKLAVGALNGLANAGVLNPGEVVDWKEKLPKHRLDNIGVFGGSTLGAALVDEEKFIGSMREDFRKRTDQRLRTYNAARDTGTTDDDLGARPRGGR